MSDDDSFTGRVRRYARVGGAMGEARGAARQRTVFQTQSIRAPHRAYRGGTGHRLAIETRPRFPICSLDGGDAMLVTGARVAVASARRAGPARSACVVVSLYFQQDGVSPVPSRSRAGSSRPRVFSLYYQAEQAAGDAKLNFGLHP